MRQGFTLIELIVVIAVVGLLAGIALPRVAQVHDQLAVTTAARELAAAHRRARMQAILSGRVTVLTVAADALTLRMRHDTTTLWRAAGPTANGVTLAGPTRKATFSPIGLAMGAPNASYVLTRGSARTTVTVSRLGRIRTVP